MPKLYHKDKKNSIKNLFYKTLGVQPDKIYWTFPQYGNVGSASIPVAMDDAYKNGRIKPGDKVLLVGGAAGFSVGVISLIV